MFNFSLSTLLFSIYPILERVLHPAVTYTPGPFGIYKRSLQPAHSSPIPAHLPTHLAHPQPASRLTLPPAAWLGVDSPGADDPLFYYYVIITYYYIIITSLLHHYYYVHNGKNDE